MPDLSTIGRAVSPRRVSILYLLAIVFVIFSLWIPDLFLSSITMQGVASSEAVVGILALGALLPFAAGEFDITVGANMALSVCIVAHLSATHPGMDVVLICLVAILATSAVGVANGLLIVKFGVNSFIATLATSQVLVAIALKMSDNQQVLAELPAGFVDFGRARTLGIPNALFVTLAVALLLWYVLQWTKLGRHLYACGLNREAARLSGVRTEGIVIGTFVASGFFAGLAGVVYVVQVGTFTNSIGAPLLFPAFAAVFLGATQFNFRPNVWGTMIAIFTLALGVQGLQLALSTGGFWITPLFDGLALVAAVVFSKRQVARTAKNEGGAGDTPNDAAAPLGPDIAESRLAEPTRT